MTEFKVLIDDTVVRQLGRDTIDEQLIVFTRRLQMKAIADDLLPDLEQDDLMNDPAWQLAREQAFRERGHHYLRQP